PRVARTERAHDHVVDLGGVFQHHHVLALAPDVAELGDRSRGVLEQALLVARIDPGLRDDARAVTRPDLRLVRVGERVEGSGVDEALVDEERLERPHAELQVAPWRAGIDVVVVVVVVMLAHPTSFFRRWSTCSWNDLPPRAVIGVLSARPVWSSTNSGPSSRNIEGRRRLNSSRSWIA